MLCTGDHFTLLNVVRAYEAAGFSRGFCNEHFLNHRSLEHVRDVRTQLEQLCVHNGIPVHFSATAPPPDTLQLKRCLLAGGYSRVAQKMPDGVYQTLADRVTVSIHPSSGLLQRKPDWVVFNELVHTTKTYIRDVSVIDASLLAEVVPEAYARATSLATSAAQTAAAAAGDVSAAGDPGDGGAVQRAAKLGKIALPGVHSAATSTARPLLKML